MAQKKWNIYIDEFQANFPISLTNGGTIYFGAGNLYSIKTDSKGLANSAWPKILGNSYNSGISHYIKANFSSNVVSDNSIFNFLTVQLVIYQAGFGILVMAKPALNKIQLILMSMPILLMLLLLFPTLVDLIL